MTNDPTKKTNRAEVILLVSLLVAALVVGYIQSAVWVSRVGWDTVSYLDIAEAFRLHNFKLALNPYWSPLFPFIIAVFSSVSPSAAGERTLLCVVQYVFFLLFCFASYLFWHAVLKAHEHFCELDGTKPLPRLPLIAFMAGVSMLSSLVVGDLAVKGPDMLAAALYLGANALIVSCLYKKPGLMQSALIGFLMGLAYLTKAFFMSWSIPCLFLLVLLRKSYGLDWKKLAIMTATMVIMMASYAVPLSISLGRLTLGESGKYQIIFSSTDQLLPMIPMVHGSQNTKHPSRIFFENPKVYEFAEPFDVSYPPWFDPHYWNEDIKANIDWKLYMDLLYEKTVTLFFGFAIYSLIIKLCFCFSARKLSPYSIDRLKLISPILLTSMFCSALLLFLSAAVARYFMGFIAPLFAGIILAYRGRGDEVCQRRERRGLCFVAALLLLAFVFKSMLHIYFFFPKIGESLSKTSNIKLPATMIDPHSATATMLVELGIKPKDRIARLGKDEGGEFYWARLAGIRIVAECVDPVGFWKAPAEKREELYRKLKDFGVKAIVIDWSNRKPTDLPQVPTEPGWQQIPNTKNYVRLLD